MRSHSTASSSGIQIASSIKKIEHNCKALTSLSLNYLTYGLLRFLTGFSTGGVGLYAFVLATELVGPSKRVAVILICNPRIGVQWREDTEKKIHQYNQFPDERLIWDILIELAIRIPDELAVECDRICGVRSLHLLVDIADERMN
ncbi:hypothetical protein L2E82_18494 [Cichorium intybus]|uniref:Uncharacterized protein n=1 Tax=Cichorium intybus TaxID=13427 RepID=A0ACB9FA95_CICIN|nr:hypothetical protein L2E82_18494 [Cichorium intybus]